MKLINAVTTFLVTTKYFVAADLDDAIGTSDNPISQGVQVKQNGDNLLQAVGQVRLRGTIVSDNLSLSSYHCEPSWFGMINPLMFVHIFFVRSSAPAAFIS